MRLLSSALAFAAISVVCAIILGFWFSGLSTSVAWSSMACGMLAAAVAWRTTQRASRSKLGLWDWVLLGVFALASLRAFLWLIYERGDEICVLSPNNLGDISLHLNLIRYLASGIPFWPESSILSNVPLSYPIGTDLFNSLLEICGVDTTRGLVWTGLAGAALTGYALWLWGGAFGVAAFLFNGGLAGFVVLRTLQVEDFQRELVWKNFFLAMFVTQRGLLFALPAGLLLLHVWRERYFRSGPSAVPFWLQLLLYASMPLFNLHAFLFLSVVLLAIFIALLIDGVTSEKSQPASESNSLAGMRSRRGDFFRKRLSFELLVLVGSALVPAAACILLVTGFFSPSSGIRFAPSWIMEEGRGHLGTWIWNFGLALPLSIILLGTLLFDRDLEARCFVWTACATFAMCCLFVFAPWEWDNMKLMLWSWLMIAPYLWKKLLAPLKLQVRAALCLLLFFSGAVSLVGGLDTRHGYAIAQRSELDAWRRAIANIPPDVRFASISDYNHPIILLGRKVACGYEGHLWSHGLDYQGKLALLQKSFRGELSWRSSAPLLDVQWLALRNQDLLVAKPPGDPPPAQARGALYDLTPLLTQDPASPESPRLPPRSVDSIW
jgi:hypothetical protein